MRFIWGWRREVKANYTGLKKKKKRKGFKKRRERNRDDYRAALLKGP